jgi:hypothetical protein
MPVRSQCWLAAGVLVASAAVAQAQPAPAPPSAVGPTAAPALSSLEVTPHVSFGPNDSSGVGAGLGFRVRPRLLVELDAEARLTNPERFQRVRANLLWELRDGGRVMPFLLVGAGYDAYRGAHEIPTVGSFGWTSSGLATSVGGGVRVPLGGRWALRTDVVWSGGVSEGVPSRMRVSQGLALAIAPR